VLHVLDADALRPPDEHGVGVRGVDDVVDLHAEVVRLGDVLVRGVDEDGEVVEQRLLRGARVALVELDVGAADLDAGRAGRAGVGTLEAEPEVGVRGLARGRGPERDVIEVVLDVRRRLDEAQAEPYDQGY